MTGYDASPQLDDDDRGHVWWRVIDELEDALAVAGMPAEDRGALAHMHQYASEWVGVEPLTIPASWKPAERTEEEEWVVRLLRRRYGREPTDAEVAERVAWHANYDIARYADNGIGKLGSIPDPAMSGLVNAGVVTIDEPPSSPATRSGCARSEGSARRRQPRSERRSRATTSKLR